MKTSRIATAILTVLLWAVPTFAQFPSAEDFEKLKKLGNLGIGAFVGLRTPIGVQSDYERWAVIELTAKKPIFAFLQWDITANYTRESYFKYTKVSGDSSWSYSLRAGQALSPILDSLAGQKSNRLTRLMDATGSYAIWPLGLRADLNWRGIWAAVAHAKDNNLIVLVSTGEVYAFWESRVGHGIMVKPRSVSNWVNPIVVISWRDFEPTASLQNFIQLPSSTRLYAQLDYNSETEEANLLTGLAYTYSKHSNLKVFYDDKLKSAVGEVTFAF